MFNLTAKFFSILAILATSVNAGTVLEAQRVLNKLGYNAGTVDGLYGRKTKSALNSFYSDRGGEFDGNLDSNEVIDLLLAAGEPAPLSDVLMMEPLGSLTGSKHVKHANAHKSFKTCYDGKSNQWRLKKYPITLGAYDFKQPFRSPFKANGNKLCQSGFVQYFGVPISIDMTVPVVITAGTNDNYGHVSIDVSNAQAWWSVATSQAVYDPKSRYSAKIIATLREWAEKDALSKNTIAPWGAVKFEVAVVINHLVETVGALGPELTAEERSIIGPWLDKLVRKIGKSDWGGRQDNKQYLADYIVALWGYINNDDAPIYELADNYKRAIHDMRNDGSIVYESLRGGSTLTYQVHAVARLVKQMALIKATTGVDLAYYRAENKRSIYTALEMSLLNFHDPLKQAKIYAKNCPDGAMGSIDNPNLDGGKYYLKPVLEFGAKSYIDYAEKMKPNQIRGSSIYTSVGNIQCMYTK